MWTIAGYEVVPATGNFFYSHGLSHFNSEPFGHTGVIGTYSPNSCMTYYVGWSLGWDTGFDQYDDGNNWVGGFTRTAGNVSFTYVSTAGNLGWRTEGEFGHTHHLVLVNEVSDCLTWVVTSDLLFTEGSPDDDDFEENDYGVTNYLFYNLNDCWGVGGRFEWWKSNVVTGETNSFYEVTGGINYRAHANLVVRPEIRYDFANEGDDLDDYNQGWFGVDAVLTY
jgi:hypothetical protein